MGQVSTISSVATDQPVAETPRKRVGRSRRGRERVPGEPRKIAYLYILPVFVCYGLFVLVPMVQSGWISFFRWDGISVGTWVGLNNYVEILADPQLRNAFVHSLVLILFFSGLPVLIGLLLVGIMSRARIRGMTFFRTVLFLPQVIAMVVMAVIWKWIYAPGGVLNRALEVVGVDALTRPWLGSFTWALPALGLVGTWMGFGLCMVIFLAGAQSIDRDLYDAARVDGAGPLREFFAVTLPGLRPQIAVAITITTITALRTFDLVYLTTSGGPGNATTVPSWEIYQRAFLTGEVGSAAAIGVVLTVIVFAVTVGIVRLGERRHT